MKSLLLLVALAPLLSQTPDENPPTSSIRGKVVNAITGEPLKNLPVDISGDTLTQTVATGADGQFVAKNLQPGMTHLSTQSPRFPGILGIDLGSVSLELKRGEDRADVVLQLTPAGSITGTVRNDRNQPVQACSIAAQSIAIARASPEIRFWNNTATDDQGTYRIEGLAAGRYFVTAKCSESLPRNRPLSKDWDEPQESWLAVFFPDAPELSSAAAVTVMPGNEVSGIDFHLRRTSVGSVRGTISYPASAHPAFLEFSLIPKGDEVSADRSQLAGMIQADSREFHLKYVPAPRPYTLSIITFNYEPGRFLYAMADVQVESGRTQAVPVEMRPGLLLHGKLLLQVDNEVNGSSSDEASIVLTQTRTQTARTARVAEDGTFTVTDLYPGTWTVSIRSGNQAQAVQSIAWGGREVEGNKIVISESALGPLNIVVGPASGGAVTGTLRNIAAALGSDSELAQRQLKAYVYPVRNGQIDADRTPRQVDIRNAQFHIDHLSSGDYFAFAVNEHVRNVRPIANLLAPQAETFFVQDGTTQSITVPVLSNHEILQAALRDLEGSSGQR